MINYSRYIWRKGSHLLAPLTELTGKSIYKWTPACQKAFDEMKAVMASDILLIYPNHNLPFELYTDASDYQMGAVIMQRGKPVAYWSRKLNSAQKNYTVMEKEMLAVVMCLKEFRLMLYGAELTIFTDHKNLTFRTLNTQRVLRWRMFMEDFSPTFKYCPGKDNVLADCFSRLPRMDKPSEGKSPNKGKLIAFDKLEVPTMHDEIYQYDTTIETIPPPDAKKLHKQMPCKFSCCRNEPDILTDPELFESFLNHPPLQIMPNPITVLNIQQHQFEDQELNQRRQMLPMLYPVHYVQNRPIICHRQYENAAPGDWRIALPNNLMDPVIRWYHQVLGHCGAHRLYDTIRRRFQAPGLKDRCYSFQCAQCQRNKLSGPGYGKLPPRHATLVPWNEVAVDLIGPWKVKIQEEEVEFNALTCIDPVTNLVEIIRVNNRTSQHIAEQFENCWLARYPRPNRCVHDNGGEFIGAEFQMLLQRHGIADAPTTSRNPQGNAVCERMHQTVANVLRTTLPLNPPQNFVQAIQLVENAIATTVYATRCSVSRALGVSPGELVFHRDMLLDIHLLRGMLLLFFLPGLLCGFRSFFNFACSCLFFHSICSN